MEKQQTINYFKKRVLVLVITVVVISVLELIGWSYQINILKYPIADAAAINPLVASNFILFSAAFLLMNGSSWSKRLGYILVAIVFSTSLYQLFDLYFGFSIHVDRILFTQEIETDGWANIPSRMAGNTAINFILSCCSFVLVSKNNTKAIYIQILSLVVMLSSTFVLLGYLYKVPEFFQLLRQLPMSPATALCFLLLGLSFLFNRPNEGLMREMTSSFAGSLAAHYLIPSVVLLPVLIGYLRIWGHWNAIFSTEFGVTSIILSFIIIFVIIVWLALVALNRRDKQKKNLDDKLLVLYKELKEANEEMATLNEELKASNEELLANNEELVLLNENLDEANQTIAKQKDEQLNRVLDSSNDVIWSFDLTGSGQNYLSRSAEKIYGEPIEKLIERPRFWLEHLHPEDRPIKEASQLRLEKIGFTECTYRLDLPGGIRWVHDRLKLIQDENNKPIRLEGIASDVTSIKMAEEEQRKQQQLVDEYRENLDIIFQNSSDYFILLNLKAEIVLFNKSFLDYTTDVAKKPVYAGMNYFDIISPNRVDTVKDILNRCLAGEKITTIAEAVWPWITKFYNVVYTPVLQNGSITNVTISSTDITEQKRQEIIATRYRENLDIIFNNSSDNFLLLGADARIILYNKSFETFFADVVGVNVRVGMAFLDVVNPNRREDARLFFERALTGETVNTEAEFSDRNGKKIYHQLRYEPIVQNKKVSHVSISGVDITLRKESENKLKETSLALAEFQDAIHRSSIVSMADKKGDITFVNENFVKISGYSVSELVGQNHRIVNSGYHPKSFWVNMWKTISKGEIWREEVKNRAKDGSYYWVDTFVMPFQDQQGNVREFLSIRNDITQRKANEEKIQSLNISLADFQKAINGSSIVSMADRHGNITFVNDNFISISGYSKTELEGQNHRIINSGFHPKSFWINMWKTISSGKVWREEVKNKAKDGSYYWVDTFVMPFLDEEGNIREYLSIRNDITERKKNVEELQRTQYFLEKAGEAGKIGYWTSEPDFENGKLTWSEEVFNIFQVEQKDFDGKNATFFKLIHPEDQMKVAAMARVAIEENQIYNIDHRILLKDGRTRWVNERAQVIRNERNDAVLMVGIVQDINDRKIIEEVFREYNDRYEILTKATNDVIYDWDIIKDRIIYNHGITFVLGYDEREIKYGRDWWEKQIHPDDHDRVVQEIHEIHEKHLYNWEFNYRYRSASGEYKYIHDRAYVVYNSEHKAIRMIGAMQDVTEVTEYRLSLEQKVEERTRKLNEALNKEKELVDLKSKFVSIASHEFRTPLSTIALASGFIRKFKDKMKPGEVDLKLENIQKQVNHMTVLLDDVLTVGKSEAGKIEVHWSTVSTKTFFKDLAQEVMNSAKNTHRINLNLICTSDTFQTDEGLMRNIVINLLTNAIKFSKNSMEIDFTVACDERTMDIRVRDFGLGIPPNDIPKLFEPFFRAANAVTVSGTGLGLSIVKKAVDLLGGTISVKSEVGEGTEFLVFLPLK